jgi:chromosomal replication initiator protein
MYLCRTLTAYSLPETGNFFGGKDHSTVIHAVRTIEAKKEKDIDLKNRIELLTKQLRS